MTSTKKESNYNNLYFQIFIVVIAVTFATRFYKVTEPDHVW